jgi:hypothetical protein
MKMRDFSIKVIDTEPTERGTLVIIISQVILSKINFIISLEKKTKKNGVIQLEMARSNRQTKGGKPLHEIT